jgi:pimeloyl-ACP methyl ester carboxylesterase
MILHSNILGKDNKKQILILHGLYGCSDSWLHIGKYLSSDYCVHLLDLRNHGRSFHSDVHDYYVMAEDIKRYAEHNNLSKFTVIGHSMGGKAAMFFAEKYQEFLDKLIIADISPRSYKSLIELESNIILHLNLISEIKNLDISCYSSYSEVENTLLHLKKNIRNLILKNLQKKNGRFMWRININSVYNNFNNIFDGFEVENFSDNKIEIKTLFIKGVDSDYIKEIDKKIIKYIFSDSEIIEIQGAGHWLHIDQPEIVKAEIKKFLIDDKEKIYKYNM